MTQAPNKPVSQVFKRDKYRCVYCNKSLVATFEDFCILNWDHLIPTSRGGDYYALENLVTACSPCNTLKRAYDPRDGEPYDVKKFDLYITRARDHINLKKAGKKQSYLYDDYQSWLKHLEKEPL